METLMTGLVAIFILVYIISKVKDCGNDPAYDAWLTEDKAKYPDLYKED